MPGCCVTYDDTGVLVTNHIDLLHNIGLYHSARCFLTRL